MELEIADYVGSRPPMRSYEPNIANCELFAFSWLSRKLQQEMYLKFAAFLRIHFLDMDIFFFKPL